MAAFDRQIRYLELIPYTNHSIGNMAAFDMDDPEAVVSPGGVGFDINCGVRLIRTNLLEKDIKPVKVKELVYLLTNLTRL